MSNNHDRDEFDLRNIDGDGPLDHMIHLATEHGNDEGNDTEIADLQQLLRAAWEVMPQEARIQFLQSETVSEHVKVWVADEIQKLPFIHGQWGHIFGPGKRETMVRFVVDCAEKKVLAMQVKDGPCELDWVDANGQQVSHLEDSVLNANEMCLQDPESYGLEFAYVPPGWAMHLVPIEMVVQGEEQASAGQLVAPRPAG